MNYSCNNSREKSLYCSQGGVIKSVVLADKTETLTSRPHIRKTGVSSVLNIPKNVKF